MFKYKNFLDYNVILININKKYNSDQHFKYGTIIEFIDNIEKKNIESILEPGCKDSELTAFLSNKYNIKNAYLFDYNIVSGMNIYEKQKEIFNNLSKKTMLEFKGGDFFSRISEIKENSIDLIIDGCSITHFCGNDSVNNSGLNSWIYAVEYFKKILKTNGYVIISTDVKDDNDIENITGSSGEFVYPKDIINIFCDNGFVINQIPLLSINTIDNILPYKLRVLTICFIKK